MLAALLQGELKEFLLLTEGLRCCGTCEFAAIDVASARELLNKRMGSDMVELARRKA